MGNFELKERAFTLVEIMVVVGIIALLGSLVYPYYVRPRATAQANACINNLIKIEAAANQFALEHGQKTGDPINYPGDLTPYLKLNNAGEIPSCPAQGTYSIGYVDSRLDAVCSLGSTVDPPHISP